MIPLLAVLSLTALSLLLGDTPAALSYCGVGLFALVAERVVWLWRRAR